MTDYSQMWSSQSQSGNRSNTKFYLERKALESYAVLKDYCGYSNERIVDLGCGAGELLEQLLIRINIVKAVDYSETMLSAARVRLDSLRLHAVPALICAGLDILPCLVEDIWISTGALSQYSSKDELELIISSFKNNESAKHFVMLDTIDPVRYFALPFISYGNSYGNKVEPFDCKLHTSRPPFKASARIRRVLKIILRRLRALSNLTGGLFVALCSPEVCQLPGSLMGYGVSPFFWQTIANGHGLKVSILSSREFEYRYHVVISKDMVGE